MNIIYYFLGWSEPEIKPVLDDNDVKILNLHDELLNFNKKKLKKVCRVDNNPEPVSDNESVEEIFDSSDDEYVYDIDITIEDIINRGYTLLS